MATHIEDRYQTVKELQDAIHGYWSHLESITLTERGQEYLAQAMGNGKAASSQRARFDEYDRARFAFEEALELWPNNELAGEGSEKTILAYADYAYGEKAYERGVALLDPNNPDHKKLFRRFHTAHRRQKGARKLRSTVIVIVLLGGLLFSSFSWWQWNRAEQNIDQLETEIARLHEKH